MCWIFRRESGMNLLAVFEQLLDEIAAGFLARHKLEKLGFYAGKFCMKWRTLEWPLHVSFTRV